MQVFDRGFHKRQRLLFNATDADPTLDAVVVDGSAAFLIVLPATEGCIVPDLDRRPITPRDKEPGAVQTARTLSVATRCQLIMLDEQSRCEGTQTLHELVYLAQSFPSTYTPTCPHNGLIISIHVYPNVPSQ